MTFELKEKNATTNAMNNNLNLTSVGHSTSIGIDSNFQTRVDDSLVERILQEFASCKYVSFKVINHNSQRGGDTYRFDSERRRLR